MQLRNNPICTKILQRSNGVDWVRSLQKIPTWLRGTNFCINCTSSPRFAPSFMQLRNYPKCTQTRWNTPKPEFRVQWGGSGAFVAKNTMWLRGTNFCINWTSLVCLALSFVQLWYDPKCTQILRNGPKISLSSNGVDWVHSLRKISSWLRGTNWVYWVCPLRKVLWRLRNDPKCTQTQWNTPKHEFRVQWGGSGAFVAKNDNVTSWHELLH